MAYYVINGKKVPYLKYDINGIIKKLEENEVKIGMSKSNSAVDNAKEKPIKKEYTKHVLIERTLTVNGYEFNFIDIETKEFYWSYYSDELDYNMAKESFLNKISGEVKFYLEE